jgi:hypothetical protein
MTGWLTPAGALSHPVDIFIKPDWELFISDDKAVVVHQVVYKPM